MGSALTTTRLDLQRVATHVLARRRHAVSGRFGLRATPGGIGTPAFGSPDVLEVVRTAGTSLVHELGGSSRVVPMAGATLADLAALVDVDLRRGRSPSARTRRTSAMSMLRSSSTQTRSPACRTGTTSAGRRSTSSASPRHPPHRSSSGPSTSTPAACSLSALAPTIVATSVCRPATTTTRSRTCTWARGSRAVRATRPTGTRPLVPCSHGRPSRPWLTPSSSTARAWPASPPEHPRVV